MNRVSHVKYRLLTLGEKEPWAYVHQVFPCHDVCVLSILLVTLLAPRNSSWRNMGRLPTLPIFSLILDEIP